MSSSSPRRAPGRAAPVLASFVLLAAGASAQFCGATVLPGGNLYDGFGLALAANGVYAVTGVVVVPSGQTLTVPAGVTFKMQPGTSFSLNGRLLVQGTPGAPVTWTSAKDDGAGGDTNCDGGASLPAPGDWGALNFAGSASASNLQHCRVRYAGAASAPTVALTGCHLTANGLVVSDVAGACLDLKNGSAPTISNSAFDGGTIAVANVPFTSLPGFSACTAAGNSVYDAQQVTTAYVTAATTLGVDDTLNGAGVLVLEDDFDVNATVTLGAGLVFKIAGFRGVNVNQTLFANGTVAAPIVFTSVKDDAVGGDTNKDGAGTAPAPGNWTRVFFNQNSDASVVERLNVRFAGGASAAAILCGGSSCVLDGVATFASSSAGISLQNNSFPTVRGCAFDGGTFAAIEVLMDAVSKFEDCTATGNSVCDQMYVNTANVTVPTTLSVANTFNGNGVIVYASNFDVNAPLTVGPGVTFKSDGVRTITVNFPLVTNGTVGAPVTFTSYRDDAVGGDSNKDGAATVAAPGDWAYIHYAPTSDASDATGMHVRFAGASVGTGPNPAIFCNGSNCAFDGLVTHQSLAAGLSLQNNSFATVTNSAFNGGTYAIRDVLLRAAPGITNCTASGNSVYDDLYVTSAVLNAPTTLSVANTLNGSGTIVLATNFDVSATVHLNAGVVLKFEGARVATINQTWFTHGTAEAPVVLTSVKDDVYGGDTNKNGGADAGAKGDWSYVVFNGSSDASVCRGLRVRFTGGGAGGPFSGVRLSSSDATFEDCAFEHGLASCFDLQNNSFPTATRCAFDDGTIAVRMIRPAAVPKFRRCTASGNSVYDAFWMNSATVASGEALTWRAINTLNGDGVVVLATGLTVSGGGRLEVGRGMNLKFATNSSVLCNAAGFLDLRGTGLEPVVITSIHDDAFGGDTNKNGAATAPAPGQWTSLNYVAGAGTAVVEHARVRFGGALAGGVPSASVLARAGAVAWRAVRVDRGLGVGFEFQAASGPCDNLVAWGNGTDGVYCNGVAPAFRHLTSAGNAGFGARKTGAPSATFVNSVVRGNGAGAFSGFPAANVSFTCGLVGGGPGNFDADPLFADLANGDLALDAASPCADVGDAAVAAALVVDHVAASRLLDGRLNGTLGADLGAYETAPFRLVVEGRPWSGDALQFTVEGPAGGVALALGGLNGTQFVPPWGFALADVFGLLQPFAFVGTGATVVVPVPDVSIFTGLPFGVQALGIPFANPAAGAFTNLYRAALDA